MEKFLNKMTIFIKAIQSRKLTRLEQTFLIRIRDYPYIYAKLYRSFALNNGDWKIDRQVIWRY